MISHICLVYVCFIFHGVLWGFVSWILWRGRGWYGRVFSRISASRAGASIAACAAFWLLLAAAIFFSLFSTILVHKMLLFHCSLLVFTVRHYPRRQIVMFSEIRINKNWFYKIVLLFSTLFLGNHTAHTTKRHLAFEPGGPPPSRKRQCSYVA